MSLTLLFVFFPFSTTKLVGGMLQCVFMGGCAVYGQFKLNNELSMIKPVTIVMCAGFPLLMLTAMLMMKSAED